MTGKPFSFNKDLVAPVYITVLTVIAVVYGFTIVPSPQAERDMSFDHKRVSDLGNLQLSVDNYYNDTGVLPTSLNILKPTDTSVKLDKTDPQTKQQYGYSITGTETYKLCATFLTDSSKEDKNTYDDNTPDYSSYKDDFKHPKGYYCFSEDENAAYDPYGTTPTIAPLSTYNPSVVLSTYTDNGNCEWTPTFRLTGFNPYSQIIASADETLSTACTKSPNRNMSEGTQLTKQTDADGNLTVVYPHPLNYGEYTFTFSDSNGNTASIHFVYQPPATAPTVIPTTPTPIPAGGSGGSGL